MNNTKFSTFRQFLASFVFLTAGAALAAFALEEFLVPATILDGGIVGVSMIVSQLTPIALGVLTFVLNIPFLIIGTKNMGLRFLVSAGYSMTLFSVLLSVFAGLKPATSEPLLAVVFGGVLLGAGVGLVLRGGGCLDGTETVALLISRKTNFSVGQIVFSINIIIYAAAGLLFGWDRALYSLLTYFITFKVIDMVENGMEEAKSVMIITQDGTAMAETIFQQLGRTCTILDGTGRHQRPQGGAVLRHHPFGAARHAAHHPQRRPIRLCDRLRRGRDHRQPHQAAAAPTGGGWRRNYLTPNEKGRVPSCVLLSPVSPPPPSPSTGRSMVRSAPVIWCCWASGGGYLRPGHPAGG